MALNPLLFCRLEEEFGHVTVTNEGLGMVTRYGQDVMTGRTRLSVISSGEYYRVNCGFCNDTRGRLWINHRWGVEDVVTGSRNLWLAICYNEDCLGEWGRSQELYDRIYTKFKNANVRAAPIILNAGAIETARLEQVDLPGQVVPLRELPIHTRVAQYLLTRGYSLTELADKYQLGLCVDADQKYGMANGRIVIPIIMEGMTVGWQCRYPGDLDWKRAGFPKYYSRPSMPKRLMLYNYDNAVKSTYVVICEGPSDVWSVGDAGVAIMGKTISDDQCMRIHANWSGGAVLVMLDGDAFEEMQTIMTRLNNFDGLVGCIPLPVDKDPGDFSPEWLQNHIRSCADAQGIQLDRLERRRRHVYDDDRPRYCGFAPEDRPNIRSMGPS